MTVLHPERLDESAARHPKAASALAGWLQTTQHASWRKLTDVRQTYAHADAVKLASGRTVTVFNIGGNKYRLLTTVDYPLQAVNVLQLLTHAEYDKEKWKRQL